MGGSQKAIQNLNAEKTPPDCAPGGSHRAKTPPDRAPGGSHRAKTPPDCAPGGNPAERSRRAFVHLDRGDVAIALLLALSALVVYVLTLAPGLLPADVAEFHTLAVTLGYAHPTGYPAYLLLAKTATVLPIGEVPYRVNLLSAVMAAAASGGIYLLGRLLTGKRCVPIAGAVAWAVSPTFWSQAIIAEVYTSGIACMVGVLLGLERWRQTGKVRWLFAAACAGGISLGVHATHALMAPAALLLVALPSPRWKANWTAAIAGAAAGTAVTLGAFFVIDRADPPTSYFHTVIEPSRSLWDLEEKDLDSFPERVALSMSPPQYKRLLFSKPIEVTQRKATDYLGNLPREFPPLWLAAAVAGIIYLARRNWRITLLLGLTFALHLFYDLFYDMGGVHVLYLATYVPIALFGVAGLAWAADGCLALAKRFGKGWPQAAMCDFLVGGLGLAVVLLPMAFADAWTVEGRRKAWLPPDERDAPAGVEYSAKFHEQVRAVVDGLEPDAVVFTGWCMLYPYYYVGHVEQGRTDLTFIQDYPQAYHFALADSALEYIERLKRESPRRPVYVTDANHEVTRRFEIERVRLGTTTLYRLGKPREEQGG